MNRRLTTALTLLAALTGAGAEQILQTRHATLLVDDRGFITSLKSTASNKEYSPKGHPSSLLSLHENGKPNHELIQPTAAVYDAAKHQFTLRFSNGAAATVSAGSKGDYFRFQLVALEPRGAVDAVVWGPLNTTVSGKIGDIIGVVRDRDFAIGMYGLDDNTIPGAVEEGDCYQMGYYIHSPDPGKFPLPDKYKEGQWFNIGGDGVNDVAFYSHPEEYFNQVFGSGAKLRPEFGSTLSYYSRDRRKSYVHHYSLLPGFPRSRPRHMTSDPLPGVDFIGSSVALYACPDDSGIETLRSIFKSEKLPYVTDRDGKWVRDPAAARPTIYWSGPVDKAIEYTKAMGFKDISRDTGEFYSTLPTTWVGQVNHGGKSIPYKEFAGMCHKQGLTHGGLHTLCMFLQGGISNSVTPVPSENLQTICRTKLAKDISPDDTEIEVTDPSFLAEKGTWPRGDDSNYLRVGGEMMRYDGISESAPWLLKGVKRGHASKAAAHKAGEELVKLQQNCYNGFVPDMKLMLAYADDYVDLMVRNGMDTINYDGYEVMAYTNHGYYAFNVFNRRLFEGYHAKTGKWPRVTGSNIFGGAWAYLNVCDLGGGNNMFNSFTGKRATEGKDIGNAFQACWFPGTFGIQGWHANWSLYDAENLMAKAVGWEATFALGCDQKGIDATGDKNAIFTAFAAWQEAREKRLFTKEQREALRDPEWKFHLAKEGPLSFTLHHLREMTVSDSWTATLSNAGKSQALQFTLRFDAPVNGCVINLPNGGEIQCATKINKGQMLVCNGTGAFVADGNRNKIADARIKDAPTLPQGESKLTVKAAADDNTSVRFHLTYWQAVKSEKLGK
ncbi:MAG: hypothetical protein J0M04_19660 [Verrucomicrobia bacterium]|nr:hypothetical protein [Verrucomicrobiota bacterium]